MRKACRVYPLAALLAATHFTPLPQSAVALALLLVGLYFLFRQHPRWQIPLALAYFFILPLLFEPVLRLLSALLAIPVLPLLNSALRENALSRGAVSPSKRRELSSTSKSVIAAIGAASLVSLLLGHRALVVTGGLGLLFLAGMVIYVLRGLPAPALEVEQQEVRLLAGSASRLSVRLKNRAGFPLHISVTSTYSWVYPRDSAVWNLDGEADLALNLAPRLSGPSEPELEVFCTDPWGLMEMRQVIRPLKLYVVPRARYAEWLARKYLEETASEAGILAATFAPVVAGVAPRGGVEYCDSRLYQPGDRLKDVDWKHSAKLRQLVVKEFSEEPRQMAVIAVNLAAADAGEADRLVYHLISSALTLARAGIPAAVAAYDHREVLAASAPLGPRELVMKALQLGQKVVVIVPLGRYLQPPDMKQVRISLRQLEGTTLEAAGKLRSLLELEKKAIEEGVREHPARKALRRVTAHTAAPAVITVISPWSHDSEALSVTLEELRMLGYGSTVVRLEELEGRGGGEDRRARAGARGYQVRGAESRFGEALEARY